MPIADDPGHLAATSLIDISLITPLPLMSDGDEELYVISNKLLGLTHELLESPASSVDSTAGTAMQERPSVLELTPPPSPVPSPVLSKAPAVLPMELVCLAFDFVNPRDQHTFAAASKVCRQWYFAAASYL